LFIAKKLPKKKFVVLSFLKNDVWLKKDQVRNNVQYMYVKNDTMYVKNMYVKNDTMTNGKQQIKTLKTFYYSYM